MRPVVRDVRERTRSRSPLVGRPRLDVERVQVRVAQQPPLVLGERVTRGERRTREIVERERRRREVGHEAGETRGRREISEIVDPALGERDAREVRGRVDRDAELDSPENALRPKGGY